MGWVFNYQRIHWGGLLINLHTHQGIQLKCIKCINNSNRIKKYIRIYVKASQCTYELCEKQSIVIVKSSHVGRWKSHNNLSTSRTTGTAETLLTHCCNKPAHTNWGIAALPLREKTYPLQRKHQNGYWEQ